MHCLQFHVFHSSSKRSAIIRRALYLMLFVALQVQAQPEVRFTELYPNWPLISMKFSVRCNGQWLYDFNQSNLRILENGQEVENYTVWCPDPGDLCPLAAALVLDASASMEGAKNQLTINATKHFVSLMDGDQDEAALIWFNNVVTMRVPMTNIKPDLHFAIEELPSQAETAAWDATYMGIDHLFNSTNVPKQCRAVVLLSDGKDNASGRTWQSVVSFAIAKQVRVFVIGVGDDINEQPLRDLAEQTGGKYYSTIDALDLNEIFERVFMDARSLYECEIYYNAFCPDGTDRVVELQIVNYCGGSTSDTKLYTAPLDSSQFQFADFAVGAASTGENALVQLPVFPIMVPSTEFIPAGHLYLEFDTSCVSFVDLGPQSGNMLQDAKLRWNRVSRGIRLDWNGSKPFPNSQQLFTAFFRTKTTDSSVCCDIDITDFAFSNGCFIPRASAGTICYFTDPPDLECLVTAPDSIRWSDDTNGYLPDPIPVSYVLKNIGDKAAKNVRYTILYDPDAMTLVQPVSLTQKGSKTDVPPWESDTVTWLVRLKARGKTDTLSFCITAQFDNSQDLTCCYTSIVEAASTSIVCSIEAPVIVAETALERYSPMPFDLTVRVFNIGEQQKDSVFAELYLDGELQFYQGETARKLIALDLAANSMALATWKLWHPADMDGADLQVRVLSTSSDADSATCEERIEIPSLDAPVLEASCKVPAFLDLDPATVSYKPNPFPVTLRVFNSGNLTSTQVSAYLHLPEGATLEATDTQRKSPPSGDIVPGDTVEFTWIVTYERKLAVNKFLPFRWSIGGRSSGGVPLDSVFSDCQTLVPAIPQIYECLIEAPDSLIIDSQSGGLAPNPIPIRVRIRNIGILPRTFGSVTAQFFTGDIGFDETTPAQRNFNVELQPGESIEVFWFVIVQPSTSSRLLQMQIKAVDNEGVEQGCGKSFFVPGLTTELLCHLELSSPGFAYSTASNSFQPPSITVSARLRNESNRKIDSVRIRYELFNPSVSIVLDTTVIGNDAEKVSYDWEIGEERLFTWVIVPGGSIPDPEDFEAIIRIVYYDSTKGWIPSGCHGRVQVGPVMENERILECSITAPDTIRFVDIGYVPEVFDVLVEVTNSGTLSANTVLATLLQDSRFTLNGPAMRLIQEIAPGVTHQIDVPYQLQVRPESYDRYDTIRILIVQDDGGIGICEHPIFIEAATGPELFVECVAIPDSIRYDGEAGRYVPEEISISVLVANLGTSSARDVFVTAIVPSGYQLVDSAHVIFPELEAAKSINVSWRIKPLCESEVQIDSLHIHVSARGGYGNALHTEDCVVVLYKEACTASSVDLSCDLPAEIRFTNSSGSYSPDPLEFSASLYNPLAETFPASQLTIQLATGFALAPGQASTIDVAELAPSASTKIIWTLIPAQTDDSATKNICVNLVQQSQLLAECCADISVVPFPEGTLKVNCTVPDSLHVDSIERKYLDSPFPVCVDVINTGENSQDSVRVRLQLSGGLQTSHQQELVLYGPVPKGGVFPTHCWTVDALPSYPGATESVLIEVLSNDGQTYTCQKSIVLPSIAKSAFQCSLILDDGDSLVAQRGGVLIPATVRIIKQHEIPWLNLQVQMALSEPLAFADGETDIKNIDAAAVHGDTVDIPWDLELNEAFRGYSPLVQITLLSGETIISECIRELHVKGIIPETVIRFPYDLFTEFGKQFSIPLIVSSADPVPVTSFKIVFSYERDLLHMTGYSSSESITALGWDVTSFIVDEARQIVSVEAHAIGSGSVFSTGTTIMNILGNAVDDLRKKNNRFYETPLLFMEPGVDEYSEMEANVDGILTDVSVTGIDGLMYISGDCILPLESKGSISLNNRPNPFNPTTRIEYSLPLEMHLSVLVYDVFGRVVRTLHNGWSSEGVHVLEFDAGGLPAGLYLCVMETPYGVLTRNMSLVK
jgi:von Willebrand factor type A domain-containing protein